MYFAELQKYRLPAAHYHFSPKNISIKVRLSQENCRLIFTRIIQQNLFYQWNNSKIHLTGEV